MACRRVTGNKKLINVGPYMLAYCSWIYNTGFETWIRWVGTGTSQSHKLTTMICSAKLQTCLHNKRLDICMVLFIYPYICALKCILSGCIHLLEWTTGLEHWTGLLDWHNFGFYTFCGESCIELCFWAVLKISPIMLLRNGHHISKIS